MDPQLAFSCFIPVRWGDMDAFGHVNNTLYCRYFEEARFQWIHHKGLSLDDDSYPLLVTIGCTFLRPVFYPDTLRIDIFISEPGRSSFMATYKVYTSADPHKPITRRRTHPFHPPDGRSSPDVSDIITTGFPRSRAHRIASSASRSAHPGTATTSTPAASRIIRSRIRNSLFVSAPAGPPGFTTRSPNRSGDS
jgi:acyl-CoA thioester hydrolase